MVEYIRDMKPRIIIIRLLKSIGVGIIVAAILAMKNVPTYYAKTLIIAYFLKVQLFCRIFGAY